ncbi:uncharacterized protein LY89DRAFT_677584 [Mollisia scopiformis]|uniref:Uncharacterized protein n=1 Tax=Mollisia scopiformis TaxID=149040 RepID=A0A132B6B9_MOLSC|nr:uncharacterized protein LY89DRAFT_677584 [Mollisia scopiformis]KUJ07803.1 hypothetical protein LY89DRAFT_677584 [Mollisia scopiformis]
MSKLHTPSIFLQNLCQDPNRNSTTTDIRNTDLSPSPIITIAKRNPDIKMTTVFWDGCCAFPPPEEQQVANRIVATAAIVHGFEWAGIICGFHTTIREGYTAEEHITVKYHNGPWDRDDWYHEGIIGHVYTSNRNEIIRSEIYYTNPDRTMRSHITFWCTGIEEEEGEELSIVNFEYQGARKVLDWIDVWCAVETRIW